MQMQVNIMPDQPN